MSFLKLEEQHEIWLRIYQNLFNQSNRTGICLSIREEVEYGKRVFFTRLWQFRDVKHEEDCSLDRPKAWGWFWDWWEGELKADDYADWSRVQLDKGKAYRLNAVGFILAQIEEEIENV